MRTRLTIWGSASTRDLLAPPSDRLPYPLGDARCRLYSRARHALFAGVRRLGLEPGDEVLVPAYHHGSEIEALLRAGLRCRFHDITPNLEPELSELEGHVEGGARALLLIHYMGRPQDTGRWRRWCDEHGLLLIEDAAQAWLSRDGEHPVGTRGDLAIFCLYKTVPVPDGAALVCTPAPAAPTGRSRGLSAVLRSRASARLPRVARLARALSRRHPTSEDAEFELGEPVGPARLSEHLWSRLVDDTVVPRRRANYERLAGALPTSPPFDTLPPGSSPMVFPLTVAEEDRAALLGRLLAADIEAVDFWAQPHPTLRVANHPISASLRSSVVGLPVHQGLRESDLERMITAVRRV